MSDMIVLLPDHVTEDVISALVVMSCMLGRLLPSDQLAFRVKLLADITLEERSNANFICLNVDGPGSPLGSIKGRKPLPSIESLKGLPTLQEFVSPWNSHKYVLSLNTNSKKSLSEAVLHAFSEATLKRLKGDAASLTSNQPVCFDLSPKQEIRETSYLAHLDAWLRLNWMALPVILTMASGLLFIGLRLALSKWITRQGRG